MSRRPKLQRVHRLAGYVVHVITAEGQRGMPLTTRRDRVVRVGALPTREARKFAPLKDPVLRSEAVTILASRKPSADDPNVVELAGRS